MPVFSQQPAPSRRHSTNPQTYICQLCYYQWDGRMDRPPRTCPRCKRYDWGHQTVEQSVEVVSGAPEQEES
jgi:rubrerythrin